MILIQLVITITGFLICSIFLSLKNPVGPGIRAFKEDAYFSTLLIKFNFRDSINGLANTPTAAFWQNLDYQVKIGESFHSIQMDVGKISLDKPKLVGQLTNGKKYC
jgi:hypothetical protein